MSSGIFKVINNMKKYTFLLILSIQPRNKNDINFALLRFVCLRIECGRRQSKAKTLLLQCCTLCKSHVIEGQNTCDQIAFCAFHTFLVQVQTNAGYIHTCGACTITTLRLGLQDPLVAHKNKNSTDLNIICKQNKRCTIKAFA